jgi:hypothetical protein
LVLDRLLVLGSPVEISDLGNHIHDTNAIAKASACGDRDIDSFSRIELEGSGARVKIEIKLDALPGESAKMPESRAGLDKRLYSVTGKIVLREQRE